MYKLHLAEHPDLRAAIGAELRVRGLLWCRPDEPCHADLLIALTSSRAPVLAQPVDVHNGRPTG
jgi:hypothetical protein